MKYINTYITEKLKINNSKFKPGPEYTLFPETKEELVKMIKEEININGDSCSLNHIDVSQIVSMENLFSDLYSLDNFNGDISYWDISNVKHMSGMFRSSKFNNNSICNWDVSNVKTMNNMFRESNFDGDISEWDVSNVEDMSCMFGKSKFNKPLNNWDVSNVKYMAHMFNNNEFFNQPLNDWDVSNVRDMVLMFYKSNFNQPLNNWNVSKVNDMYCMFVSSEFNQDISMWKINNKCRTDKMLNDCPIEEKYKPIYLQ
jgi:hypothetical protein